MLCQQTSPNRWIGNMNLTSLCEVTNSAHPATMTTMRHWIWNSDVDCKGICNIIILLIVYLSESFFCFICGSSCFAYDKLVINWRRVWNSAFRVNSEENLVWILNLLKHT